MNAIEDMVHYYKNNDDKLRDELLCFLTLLNRARPLPEAEMEQVLRRIRMYDPLLEEDPWVQAYASRQRAEGVAAGKAEERAEGKAEGKIEGKTEGIRQSVEMLVQTRFPELIELARERAGRIQDPTILQQILVAIGAFPDENRARNYLLALPIEK